MTSNPPLKEDRTNRGFAAQLPKNLAANIAYFLVSVIIGVFLVPYFVSTLGVAAYGLIPLTTSITGFVGIVVTSLNTAVTRFLTIDLRRGDYAAANRTFNTALFGFSAVILLMMPVVVTVAYFVPTIFNVPIGQESGAILLFLGVSAAFLLRAWSGNFTVPLFAYNRLDLQNIVNITNILVQTGLLVLLFTLLGANLAIVGGAYFIGAVVASGISIVLARRVCPHLNMSFHSFDRTKVGDLCGMGGWIVIDQIGDLFLFQIDLIIINLLFGAVLAGEYAIALQWGILIQAIAATITSVLVPTILAYYALNQTETLVTITQSAVKFMGLSMALPVGLISGFAPQLLTIWVGAEHNNLAPLMVLLTANLAVNMSVLPLFSVSVAYNRVRIPGLVTILFGLAKLILAITLPLMTGWGYFGVAISGVLILTCRHMLFVPWYTARLLHIRIVDYIKSIVPGIFALALIGGAAAVIAATTSLTSLYMLIIAGTGIMLTYAILVFRVGLTPFEKHLLESYLPQGLKRFYGKVISNIKE